MFCTDFEEVSGPCARCRSGSGGNGATRGRRRGGGGGRAGRSVGGGSSTRVVTPSVASPGGPVCAVPGSAQDGAPVVSPGRRRTLRAVLAARFFCWLACARMSRWNCAAWILPAIWVRSLAAAMSRIFRSAIDASMRASSSS